METVKVSKKYQVVIPEKLRKEAKIKPGDTLVALAKHGILQYVPVRALKKTKGMIPRLDTEELRDETEHLLRKVGKGKARLKEIMDWDPKRTKKPEPVSPSEMKALWKGQQD